MFQPAHFLVLTFFFVSDVEYLSKPVFLVDMYFLVAGTFHFVTVFFNSKPTFKNLLALLPTL